ncbi:MAG TPA: hypothetical protein VEZ90_12075 [Blastocatellia bacterium]|nr:hypothetical protein [Blastocatellia bacterium]
MNLRNFKPRHSNPVSPVEKKSRRRFLQLTRLVLAISLIAAGTSGKLVFAAQHASANAEAVTIAPGTKPSNVRFATQQVSASAEAKPVATAPATPDLASVTPQAPVNPEGNVVLAELSLDDGTFEQGVGRSAGGMVTGVNRLTPAGYPASLSTIAIFFAANTGVHVGDSITLLLATNPSGKTLIDGLSFRQINATVGQLGTFNSYPVPALEINSGDFVVGFSMNTASNVFPFAEDQTGFQGRRSYFSTDGAAFPLVDSLGSNIAGNFGIRAEIAETISAFGSTPFAANVSADLEAGVLIITGTGTDNGSDMTSAEVTLVDDSGKTVGDTGRFSVNFGSATNLIFLLQVNDMNPLPTASVASVVIIDDAGNRSAPVNVDFGRADPDAPRLRNITRNSRGKLVITGKGGFSGSLQLEINGVIVAPPLPLRKISGTTLTVNGSNSALNLSSGPNRVRVFSGNFKSNSFVFNN